MSWNVLKTLLLKTKNLDEHHVFRKRQEYLIYKFF